jgi:hypothetical protein
MSDLEATTKPAGLQPVKHGAYSDAILSTVASEVAEVLIAQCPWVLDLDQVAIEQYCRVEARVRLLTDYMYEIIEEKGPGKVPPYIWGEITRAETNAFRRADSLGLSPEGRIKIAKDASVTRHFSVDHVGSLREAGRNLRVAQ